MPLALSIFISPRAICLPSRSPNLYFPPGRHTQDRHSIPHDRLHISFSDPVLVAAEQNLANLPNDKRQSNQFIITESSARKTTHFGSVHVKGATQIPSQTSGDYVASAGANEAVDSLMIATSTQRTSPGILWKAGFQPAVSQGPSLLDTSDESCDITEVMSIMTLMDVLPDNADNSASKDSAHGHDLPPLASDAFKEELYVRGYLRRPTSRPANVVPRKSRIDFMSVSRKILPKLLGRRRGRRVTESANVEQDAVETPSGPNAHLSEKHLSTIASATLRAPRADGLDSPGTDTNTSASESFDLHEFSYITAFTTPPSSPSFILDAETLNKTVSMDDSKHAA